MKKKTVIFDLYGVLFFLKPLVILKQIGWLSTLRFFCKYRTTPYDKYYEILDKMREEMPGEYQDVIAFRGNYLPASFCSWQRGLMSNQEALEKLLQFIEILDQQSYFAQEWEYQLFKNSMRQSFDSKNRIPTMQPNNKLIKNIAALKESNQYSLLMLTNIDHELLDCLQKAFPEIFALFDDIIASCQVQLIKPEKAIFEHVLQKHAFDPQEAVFIDDQQENIASAESLGIKGLLYTKGADIYKLL
ncbi:MAG: HAD-IA family hydrolase [Candidatus Babeliales bacterium]